MAAWFLYTFVSKVLTRCVAKVLNAVLMLAIAGMSGDDLLTEVLGEEWLDRMRQRRQAEDEEEANSPPESKQKRRRFMLDRVYAGVDDDDADE